MESYANKVGKGVKKRKKLNILDILLERKDVTIDYNLKKEELSKLLFKKMKMSRLTLQHLEPSMWNLLQMLN